MVSLETVNGVIIREKQIGEQDKAIAVLTKEMGVIEALAKGAMKINSKLGSATQLFTYSKLCFNKNKDRYYLNSCEPINLFYNIRLEVDKYALACYFADIIHYTIQINEPCENVARLMMNTLYFLDNGKVSNETLKAIFEFRHICEIGLMPQLLCCRRCYRYSTDLGLNMYFDMKDSMLLCEDCYNRQHADNTEEDEEDTSHMYKLSPQTVEILRYIALCDQKKLFHLKMSEKRERSVSFITEEYLETKLDVRFNALTFYRSISH